MVFLIGCILIDVGIIIFVACDIPYCSKCKVENSGTHVCSDCIEGYAVNANKNACIGEYVQSGLLYTGQRKLSVYTRERTQRRPTCITVMGENYKCTINLYRVISIKRIYIL